jgi:cytochrome c oxidase accessory protein FixG
VLDGKPVRGFFRRLRTRVDAVLIAILFLVPWLELGGEPVLRLDLPHRRFHVLGLVIFPDELLFLWLIVIGLALALFFFTALAGRLWCGWGCPQSVFSDLFAGIARRLEGWRGTRAPARPSRAGVVATHLVWAALSLVIGFHLVAYFSAPRELASDLLHRTVSGTRLGFLLAASGLAYFDFGIVRQTFCKYLCPYARFQGVLFDADTLVVAYDAARGEPRGKRGKAAGDCVDCGLCVAVCPTQIDIRQGLQLECIACTQCIDACDGVMAKLGRAPRLIGYRAVSARAASARARILRPRVVAYGALLAAVVVAFAAALRERSPFEVFVGHNAASLYATLSDGRPGNAYTLRLENRDTVAHRLELSLEAPAGFDLVTGVNPIELAPTASRELRVFVAAPHVESASLQPIAFTVADVERPAARLRRSATFIFEGTPK